MKKFDYKKHLYKTVIIILVVFFVGGVVIGGASILHMDGAYPPYEADASLFDPPETADDAVRALNEALAKTVKEMPKTEARDDCSIDGGVVFSSGEELLGVIADAAEDAVEDAYDDAYEATSSDFGEPTEQKLAALSVSPADVEKVECKYLSYVCANCGASFGEHSDKCEQCELTGTLEARMNNEYEITLRLKEDSASFLENFTLRTAEEIQALLADNSDGWYTAAGTQIRYTEPAILFLVNRLDGQLKRLDFRARAELTSDITFNAPYEQYGKTNAAVTINDDVRYDFTWPYLSLPDQEPLRPGKTYTIEPRKNEAIQFRRIPDDLKALSPLTKTAI